MHNPNKNATPDDGFEHFDRQAAKTTGQRSFPKGTRFYHGYQGDRPTLNNDRPLWITTDQLEASQYRDWGRRASRGGVLVLAAKRDIEALGMMPHGGNFLRKIGRSDHAFYAECLHRWAMWRDYHLIDEGGGAFISMRPAQDFSIVEPEDELLNGVDK